MAQKEKENFEKRFRECREFSKSKRLCEEEDRRRGIRGLREMKQFFNVGNAKRRV